MKKNKLVIIILLFSFVFTSCADEKTFNINGQDIIVKPYGWANADVMKNDSILYQANIGNVVWSIILVETVVVPVWLTGWELYEPLKKKENNKQTTK